MRTLLITTFLAGCTTYPTLEEACNDTLPNGEAIAAEIDKETALWMNCHRRQARAGQARVHTQLQSAVEAHIVYLETNTPFLDQFRQFPGNEPFTGATPLDRARAEGWAPINGSRLLALMTIEGYEFANLYTGRQAFDLWFAYPVFRQAWLQNPNLGFGVASGSYTVGFPEDSDLEDIPLSLNFWNILYQVPTTPYAQAPIRYPPPGAEDVPASYIHLVDDDLLELGGEYGYPITFTVGVGETSLVVNNAALIGPSGPVSINVLTPARSGLQDFRNTIVIVPDDPLAVGSTYTASVVLSTDQGPRRASKTTFTVGSRVLPTFDFVTTQARTAGGTPVVPELKFEAWSMDSAGVVQQHGPLTAR